MSPSAPPSPSKHQLTAVEELLAKQAITEVLYRYCRGIDRLDLDLVRSCYHPDATDEHGSFSGSVDDYLVWVERLLRRYTHTWHSITNVLVEIDGPHSARVESYGVARHRNDDDDDPTKNLVTGFRFVDRFVQRDGAWRILRRVAITEWVTVDDRAHRFPIAAGLRVGRRDEDDALYHV